jgi:hypothetical protein
MLVEIGVSGFAFLLTCSNFSSYVAMVAKKEYKPLDSSHKIKIKKARIHCFSHFHPDLFPHEDGFAIYFNDYDTNLPGLRVYRYIVTNI